MSETMSERMSPLDDLAGGEVLMEARWRRDEGATDRVWRGDWGLRAERARLRLSGLRAHRAGLHRSGCADMPRTCRPLRVAGAGSLRRFNLALCAGDAGGLAGGR